MVTATVLKVMVAQASQSDGYWCKCDKYHETVLQRHGANNDNSESSMTVAISRYWEDTQVGRGLGFGMKMHHCV